MIRPAILICTALALVLPFDSSRAAANPTPQVTCKVLLPETAVPGDPGFFITIHEAVFSGHDGHRLTHDPVTYYYVVSGTGTLSIDGKPDLPLVPGTVAVIPSRVVHQFHRTSSIPLVLTGTYLETHQERTLTAFVGAPDENQGCPRVIK